MTQRMNHSFRLTAALTAAIALMPCVATAGATENFDGVIPPALPSGWTAGVASGGASDIPFHTRAGYASSAPNAVSVDDVNDYADIALTSPSFTVNSVGSTFSFKHAYTLWAPDSSPLAAGAFNGTVLEIAVSFGPFTDFVAAGGTFTAGGYNATLDPGFDNPLAQSPRSAAPCGAARQAGSSRRPARCPRAWPPAVPCNSAGASAPRAVGAASTRTRAGGSTTSSAIAR